MYAISSVSSKVVNPGRGGLPATFTYTEAKGRRYLGRAALYLIVPRDSSIKLPVDCIDGRMQLRSIRICSKFPIVRHEARSAWSLRSPATV
jgi:hypothetical protein